MILGWPVEQRYSKKGLVIHVCGTGDSEAPPGFPLHSLQDQQQIPALNPLLCSWTNYTSQSVLSISGVLFVWPLFEMQRPVDLMRFWQNAHSWAASKVIMLYLGIDLNLVPPVIQHEKLLLLLMSFHGVRQITLHISFTFFFISSTFLVHLLSHYFSNNEKEIVQGSVLLKAPFEWLLHWVFLHGSLCPGTKSARA